MNVELADYLIGLDKYIAVDGKPQEKYELIINYPMTLRLNLFTPDDGEQNLFVDLWESKKKAMKIALHHQDDNTQYGLLRVDYHSRHRNPEEILDSVPAKFLPFAGMYLDDYAGHIHYVVDGYKPLAWAIPLQMDDFPVKDLKGRDDYAQSLKAFFARINIRTEIKYQTQLRSL